MGFLRLVVNDSIMIIEADINELLYILEDLLLSLRNLRVNRLVIDYVEYSSSNSQV